LHAELRDRNEELHREVAQKDLEFRSQCTQVVLETSQLQEKHREAERLAGEAQHEITRLQALMDERQHDAERSHREQANEQQVLRDELENICMRKCTHAEDLVSQTRWEAESLQAQLREKQHENEQLHAQLIEKLEALSFQHLQRREQADELDELQAQVHQGHEGLQEQYREKERLHRQLREQREEHMEFDLTSRRHCEVLEDGARQEVAKMFSLLGDKECEVEELNKQYRDHREAGQHELQRLHAELRDRNEELHREVAQKDLEFRSQCTQVVLETSQLQEKHREAERLAGEAQHEITRLQALMDERQHDAERSHREQANEQQVLRDELENICMRKCTHAEDLVSQTRWEAESLQAQLREKQHENEQLHAQLIEKLEALSFQHLQRREQADELDELQAQVHQGHEGLQEQYREKERLHRQLREQREEHMEFDLTSRRHCEVLEDGARQEVAKMFSLLGDKECQVERLQQQLEAQHSQRRAHVEELAAEVRRRAEELQAQHQIDLDVQEDNDRLHELAQGRLRDAERLRAELLEQGEGYRQELNAQRRAQASELVAQAQVRSEAGQAQAQLDEKQRQINHLHTLLREQLEETHRETERLHTQLREQHDEKYREIERLHLQLGHQREERRVSEELHSQRWSARIQTDQHREDVFDELVEKQREIAELQERNCEMEAAAGQAQHAADHLKLRLEVVNNETEQLSAQFQVHRTELGAQLEATKFDLQRLQIPLRDSDEDTHCKGSQELLGRLRDQRDQIHNEITQLRTQLRQQGEEKHCEIEVLRIELRELREESRCEAAQLLVQLHDRRAQAQSCFDQAAIDRTKSLERLEFLAVKLGFCDANLILRHCVSAWRGHTLRATEVNVCLGRVASITHCFSSWFEKQANIGLLLRCARAWHSLARLAAKLARAQFELERHKVLDFERLNFVVASVSARMLGWRSHESLRWSLATWRTYVQTEACLSQWRTGWDTMAKHAFAVTDEVQGMTAFSESLLPSTVAATSFSTDTASLAASPWASVAHGLPAPLMNVTELAHVRPPHAFAPESSTGFTGSTPGTWLRAEAWMGAMQRLVDDLKHENATLHKLVWPAQVTALSAPGRCELGA